MKLCSNPKASDGPGRAFAAGAVIPSGVPAVGSWDAVALCGQAPFLREEGPLPSDPHTVATQAPVLPDHPVAWDYQQVADSLGWMLCLA